MLEQDTGQGPGSARVPQTFFPPFCIAEHQHLEISSERRAASHAQALTG